MGKDKPPGALALQGLSDRRSQVHPPAQRSKTVELIQPIMNRMRRRRVTGVAIFRLKAIGRQLALAPIGTPPMLGRQRLACLQLQDDLVDLGAIQRALDAHHGV